MAGQVAIYDATLACHHVFRDLVAVPILEEWAENCLADLNLWANGAGALKVGKASLDARLSSNLDAKNFVVNLLRMLQAFAEKCVELGSEVHSDIPETSELSQAIQDVKYIIGQLSRITVSIRKAGTNARIQKADASYDPHHPQIEALSLHLQLLLLAKPSRNGALQAKKTSAQGMLLVSCIDNKPVVDSYSLTAIQQRLIEANLKRRNRFLYAQRHAMKLRERDQVPSTSIPTPQKLPSPPVLNTLKRTAEKHEVPNVNSTTTATEVQDPIPLPTQATTQPATTVISAISSRVTYPKPPPVRSDRNKDLEELPAMGSGGETTENNQLTEENIRDLLTNPNVENDMLDAFLNGVENQESPQEPSALAITNLASTVLESRSSSVTGSVEERPVSIISSLSPRSNPSPAASNTDVGDEGREKRQCPWPDCGRSFKDLKAHMLTHQDERPEKCPIVSCEYHIKGFARKNDRNRHTLTHYKGQMVCGFCPNAGSAAEKIFNRADVFKRHLISIHGVRQTEFNYRKRSPISSSMEQQKPLPGYSEDATGKCSTCSTTFSNAQDFYEHLDDCILRAVQQEEPSEAINQKRLAEVANDEDVKLTLEKHNLLYTGFTDDGGIFEGADYGAVKMLIEKGAAAYNKTSGDGSTLLSLAARRGDEAVVKVLIEKGAIVDSVDTPYGRTPLSWAAENGHEGVVKLLIEKGAAVDTNGQTPLSWAAENGHEAVAKVLIEKGAAVSWAVVN
ncbi:hypothetical protein TCE0_060f18765 [Talaromyces pinophilus]|uniref:C2H2-type domain-containing protein n=1 Tax=Talaromyces pinophilus TaxID=128442 RepID=A0A6V8HPW9_TALPI|nr:hypothetical protein TCE0_060f18765 [Talaromyces pinophilus]